MAFEMKNGQGSLFKNDKKEKPNQPDYRGRCVIDGTEYRISAWVKECKTGEFFSLNIQPDSEVFEQKPKKTATSDLTTDQPADDIPF